jgi:hypothetical protein
MDIYSHFWQDRHNMQKIERWRIEELILVLRDLVDSLQQEVNRDWAHVFEHYLSEAERLLLTNTIRVDEFKRLVHNILCCYLEGDSFRRMAFPETTQEGKRRNKNFQNRKARLYHLLTELQTRFVEYVH